MVGKGGAGAENADPLDAVAAVGAGFFGGGGTPAALIGTGSDEATAGAILDRSLEFGLTIIDTAHSYAGGESERMIGRWLSAGADRRRRVGIVDKLGAFDRGGEISLDLHPATVLRCAAESRSWLMWTPSTWSCRTARITTRRSARRCLPSRSSWNTATPACGASAT